MKICFCDNSIKSLLGFRGDVIAYFLSKGHQVFLLAPILAERDSKTIIPEGCTLVKVNMDPSAMSPIKDSKLLLEYFRLYRKIRPDAVFNYTIKPNIYSCLAAKILGIKVVDMLAGLGYVFSGNNLLLSLARKLYRFGLRRADKVFVLNEINSKFILENNFVSPKNLVCLSNGEGVNLEKYPYKDNNFEKGSIFLMVARVLYDKGYSEFIEAAKIIKAKHPNVKFEILGPIDNTSPMSVPLEVVNRDMYEGYFEYCGETLDVQSYIERDGVVLVLPSYHEGMNRSLMEGCSMGRPIITSDIPGCRELVEEGVNGFLCKSKDTASLVEALEKFIHLDDDEKTMMSRNSRRIAEEKFDVRKVYTYYEEALK